MGEHPTPAQAGWVRVAISAAAGATLFHALLAVVAPLVMIDLTFSPGVQAAWFVMNVGSLAFGVAAFGFLVSLTLAITLMPVASGVAWTLGGRGSSLPAAVLLGGFVSMLAFGGWELALAWRFNWPPEPVASVLLLAGLIGQFGAAYALPLTARRAWRQSRRRRSTHGPLAFGTRGLLVATAWFAVAIVLFKLPSYYGSDLGPHLFVAFFAQPLAAAWVVGVVRRSPTLGEHVARSLRRLARRAGLDRTLLWDLARGAATAVAIRRERTSS